MEASSSSSPLFGYREEDLRNQIKLQQQLQLQKQIPTTVGVSAPPPKKKRNLPGTPNPDAEVVALSPKTLLATNRFICEVCNKGFQREQNLQLHRRGHNLPWKLKQKSTKEVRRKVYLCPEPTCVHHEPSRALGDLTGIKKHYCRKHGEKKWKCDKCSKRYAVQSDWKAHSKICGTREYRCDCGTLFSRRDSFITHRAFCDALAQETARVVPGTLTPLGAHLYSNTSIPINIPTTQLPSPELLQLGSAAAVDPTVASVNPLDQLSFCRPSPNPIQPQPAGLIFSNGLQDHFSNSSPIPRLPTSPNTQLLVNDPQFPHSNNPNQITTLNLPLQSKPILPQMSATALLQKAAQMGSTTTTTNNNNMGCGSSALPLWRTASFTHPSSSHLQSFVNNSLLPPVPDFHDLNESAKLPRSLGFERLAGSDVLTRDFLGVGGVFTSIGDRQQQHRHHHHPPPLPPPPPQQQQQPRQQIGSFDAEMKSGNLHRSFRVENLQR